MNIPKLSDFPVSGKRVIVRLDLDVDDDYSRLESAEETLDFLVKNRAKTIIIGHKGRPSYAKVFDPDSDRWATEGKPEKVIRQKLSLATIAEVLGGVVGEKVGFVDDIVGPRAQEMVRNLPEGELILLENLRFDPRESFDYAQDKSAQEFAKSLAFLGDFYVNEAFAVSHREHVSIVGLPKLLPHAAGFRFIKEVENLNRVLENPKRPIVLVISGIKKDKMEYVKNFTKVADKILVGGRLPIYFGKENPDPQKVIIGDLTADTFDITINTIERFKAEIIKAGTIILAGVPGKYEDEGHMQGTKEVFEAIANSSAFKLVGGGDAEAAITLLGLNDKFDWISVGGGAMLEFLARGTLPGIEGLKYDKIDRA